MELKDKIVLVTGAGSGIGRDISLMAAARGAVVVLWDLRKEGMEETAKLIGRASPLAKVHLYTCDVSDREMVYKRAKEVMNEVGDVDMLVNNGIVSGGSFLEIADDLMVRSMQVNCMAHFWTCKAFLPAMLERDSGHIVSIASAAGLVGSAGMTDYAASKFGAFGFNESLRMELKKQKSKVQTTVICPAFVDTGMFRGYRANNPLAPALKPAQVAKAVIDSLRAPRPMVTLPTPAFVLYLLRLLPIWLFDWVMTLIGVNSAMDSFQGRGADWNRAKLD